MSDAATDQIPEEELAWIVAPLRSLAVPIDTLTASEKNPRRGDVEAVATSLKIFGQRKSITAKIDGTITAGAHTWMAAKLLGKTCIACVLIDDDEETATAWGLSDNRTHDLGDYDQILLAEAIESVRNEKLLAATGYDQSSIDAIVASVREIRNEALPDPPGDDDNDEEEGKLRDPGNPVVQYQLIFSNEEHQQAWYRFVRWLKKTYEGDTLSDRLYAFIGEVVPSEDE